MSKPRPVRAAVVAAMAIAATLFTGSAAAAATVDQTPPTTTFIGYSEGFYCLTLIIEADRSSDNVTPAAQLRYEAWDDGVFIGTLTDQNQPDGPWGVLQMTKPGPNTITVFVVDAAGNRSAPSNQRVVTGYYTPGCTPYHF